jgi:hypothetical protein
LSTRQPPSPAVEPKKPMVFFREVSVFPPPGGFLQAVASAEAAMAARVQEACEDLGGCDWEWQAADGAMGKARFGGTK